mmetsp:Transcript_66350/g.154165  ORF Transcript_66350/g.154165 Transcript_66350/m.154165 type:complete len:350 (-) Transcript_66350:537-1586(-)
MEEEVARFEVVMDDLPTIRVHVPEATEDLDHDATCLTLGHCSAALHVLVKRLALTELKHSAKGLGRDRKAVLKKDNTRMVQRFLDVVLAHGTPNEALALLVAHVLAKFVDLDSAIPVVLEVVRTEHLTEASTTNEVEQLVPLSQQRVGPEVGPFCSLKPLHLLQVQRALDFQALFSLLHGQLFSVEKGHPTIADLPCLPQLEIVILIHGAAPTSAGASPILIVLATGPTCTRPCPALPVELPPQTFNGLPVFTYPVLDPHYGIRLVTSLPCQFALVQRSCLSAEPEVILGRGHLVALLCIFDSRNLYKDAGEGLPSDGPLCKRRSQPPLLLQVLLTDNVQFALQTLQLA